MARSKQGGWGSLASWPLLSLVWSGCGGAPPLGIGSPKPAVVSSATSGIGLGGPVGTGSGPVGTPSTPSTEPSEVSDTGCDTASVRSLYYVDGDGDGFGTTEAYRCAGGLGWAESGGDCDDERRDVYPGAVESTCRLDANCDGEVEACREIGLDEAVHVVEDHFGAEVVGDLDGDGALEIRVMRSVPEPDGDEFQTYRVLSGRGLRGSIDAEAESLAWSQASTSGLSTSESYLMHYADRVHDVNGDGLEDLYLQAQRTVLYGPLSDGLNLSTPHQMSILNAFIAGRGDLTGDGADDLLALSAFVPADAPSVALVPGPFPSGAVNLERLAVLQIYYKAEPDDVVGGWENQWGSWFESVGDTDGDGVPEVVIADVYDEFTMPNDIENLHHVFDLDLRGDVTLDEAKVKFQGGFVAGIGDTDGDGYTDLIATNGNVCPEASCVLYGPLEEGDWRSNRSTKFLDSSFGVLRPALNEVGDIDGDGRSEIAVNTSSGALRHFSVIAGGVPSASFEVDSAPGRVSFTSDRGVFSALSDDDPVQLFAQLTSFREPYDLDGDGRADLVFSVGGSETSIFYGSELSW